MKKKGLLITVLSLVIVLAVSTVTMAGFFDWLTGGNDFDYYSPEKLKQSIEQKKDFLLVDIQPQKDFNNHHIKGAIGTYAYPVKLKQDKAKLDEILPKLKKLDDDIVIVCPRGGGGAKRTYKYLSSQGIKEKRLYILEDGQAGWPYEQLLADKKVETIATEELPTQLDEANYFEEISTQILINNIANEDWVVVDTRLTDAFNGWKLEGISQGGHIKGAIDFSANWLRVEAKDIQKELKRALKTKNITQDKTIVLYDVNGKDRKAVGEYLKAKGYEKIYYYDLNHWIDKGKSLVKFENYHLIVPAVMVKSILNGKRPETFKDANEIKVVEASWGEEKTSYAKGHIPTTFHINTDSIEPPPEWMLADDKTLTEFALKHGFNVNDTVIVTGEDQMAAYRVASVLRYIGVSDVRVLNGGNLAWTMAGYELEKKRHEPEESNDFGAEIPVNPDIIDTIEEVKKGLESPESFTLVDNRTWEEHIGESTGYSYHDKAGRIPGAKFGYAGYDDATTLDYFRNPDNTMRNPNEFIELWLKQGIDLDTHLSFMCGSGWRAAEVFYYADVYGIDDIAIYSDGWIGWSNDSLNPIETGKPSK